VESLKQTKIRIKDKINNFCQNLVARNSQRPEIMLSQSVMVGRLAG
jgi:hypothetical protein